MKTSWLLLVLLLPLIYLKPHHPSAIPRVTEAVVPADSLLKKGQLKCSIISLGKFSDNAAAFTFTNLTDQTLDFYIEPGRRCVSDDSTAQDILIVKRKNISLPPFEKVTVNAYGYCCESTMHAPQKGSAYAITYMESQQFIRLAEVISDNTFPTSAEQHAVWVISNGHSIASVTDEDPAKVQLLRETLAKIKNIELPWYHIAYEKDSVLVFSGRHTKISGQFEYYVKNNAVINITVKNKNGTTIRKLTPDSPHNPGNFTYYLDLDVKGWPKGDYRICVLEDHSTLNLEKAFSL